MHTQGMRVAFKINSKGLWEPKMENMRFPLEFMEDAEEDVRFTHEFMEDVKEKKENNYL